MNRQQNINRELQQKQIRIQTNIERVEKYSNNFQMCAWECTDKYRLVFFWCSAALLPTTKDQSVINKYNRKSERIEKNAQQ